jgi:hypothetical protein
MNLLVSLDRRKRVRVVKAFCNSFIVFAVLWGFCSLWGGQVKTMPDTDDKELYVGALHFVARMYDKAEADPDPAKLIYMRAALCRETGLNERDLALLIEEAHTSESTVWKGGPHSSQLQGNERTNAITSVKHSLAGKLSVDGWASFRTFVNGPFRKASFVMRAQVGSAKH